MTSSRVWNIADNFYDRVFAQGINHLQINMVSFDAFEIELINGIHIDGCSAKTRENAIDHIPATFLYDDLILNFYLKNKENKDSLMFTCVDLNPPIEFLCVVNHLSTGAPSVS